MSTIKVAKTPAMTLDFKESDYYVSANRKQSYIHEYDDYALIITMMPDGNVVLMYYDKGEKKETKSNFRIEVVTRTLTFSIGVLWYNKYTELIDDLGKLYCAAKTVYPDYKDDEGFTVLVNTYSRNTNMKNRIKYAMRDFVKNGPSPINPTKWDLFMYDHTTQSAGEDSSTDFLDSVALFIQSIIRADCTWMRRNIYYYKHEPTGNRHKFRIFDSINMLLEINKYPIDTRAIDTVSNSINSSLRFDYGTRSDYDYYEDIF